MINTLNESNLHKTLKTIYSLQNEGSETEKEIGSYIADIITQDQHIIEIQTGSLGHLKAKIQYFIDNRKYIKVVYPLVTTKYIETKGYVSDKITRRKSPKKLNIYTAFKEFTGLVDFIQSKYFTLEVIDVIITEERSVTAQPMQSANNRRRYKKNWIKTGKRLESIESKTTLHGKSQWKSLLPSSLVSPFTVNDLKDSLLKNGYRLTENNIRLIIWFYIKAEIIELTGKKNRSNIYILK